MQKSSIQYILKLSVPIFFANLAVPLVGIIDTALMGNLEELSYLSATSIAANLFSMIFWSFGFLRMGTVGLVSHAHGQNDYSEISNILLRNLLFVLILSITLFMAQGLILLISLKIFSLSNDTAELFKQYFKIRIYSAPGELTLYIITGLFIGLQKTKVSSFAVGLFSILNIILSVIFVTKYELNIKGVAYGTLLSAIITSVLFLIYTFWYLNKFSKTQLSHNAKPRHCAQDVRPPRPPGSSADCRAHSPHGARHLAARTAHARVSLNTDLVVLVGYSMPATPSSTR